MGDQRHAPPYERIRSSPHPVEAIRLLDDAALVTAFHDATRDDIASLSTLMAQEIGRRLLLKGAVVDAMSDGVVAVDSAGAITCWNPAAADLLGQSPREGDPIGFILEPRPDCQLPQETLRTGLLIRCESTVRRADGSGFPATVTCAPILRDGDVEGAILVLRDEAERIAREQERRENQRRIRYLAEATLELTSTLDYGVTLEHIVRLAVPRLATWSMVHAPDKSGHLTIVAAAHEDPEKEQLLRDLGRENKLALDSPTQVATVFRSGEAAVIPQVDETMLARAGLDADMRDKLERIGLRWGIHVPLEARGHVIGVLTLASDEAGRPLSSEDLPLAEELARRAAMALDNALLFEAEHRSREEAEEGARRLARLKERYETLATASSQAVFLADADGCAGPDQPQWTALTGQRPEEVAGFGWVDAYHPDDRQRALQLWREALTKKDAFEGDYRLRLADGSYRLFAVRVVPVLDKDGSVREWIGTCTDVSERRRIEDELRRSEERHRQMVELIPDPIVVHRQGNIMYANPAALELLGAREPGELLGRSVLDFVHPDSRDTVVRRMQEMARNHEPLPLEDERIVRLDGQTREVQVAVMPIFYDGTPAAQLLLRDVTSERAATEQLHRFNETLETRVRDRTAELTMLNRELEAFSYTVSHDLRAPLRGVATFANILAEDHAEELSSEARELVERIRRDSNRMGQLIQDLLALSRTGRGEVVRERLDLAELARTVWRTLERQDPSRLVEFITPDQLEVNADPRLLRVVLENLLANAWKFTSRTKDPRVELGVAVRDGTKHYFVRDNGAGFDMAQADRLFQPFQRLHEGGEFEGTGVGLATVARIIQRHGGKVRAEGERGKGATIWFTLGDE